MKITFYNLMIQHALHVDDFLNICKFYQQIYNTPSVTSDESKWKEALVNVIVYIVLSPFDNEQNDLIHRIEQDEKIAKIPLLK